MYDYSAEREKVAPSCVICAIASRIDLETIVTDLSYDPNYFLFLHGPWKSRCVVSASNDFYRTVQSRYT